MSVRRIVAIHQPNFFPWLGYFDKIQRADVFILMDNVQFPKKGGSWSNRVQLAINGKATWVTMPVVRSYHGTRLIKEMQIDNSIPWREKLIRNVQANYARSPFFEHMFPLFTDLVDTITDSLVNYNESVIRAVAAAVGLDTSKLVTGSTVDCAGAATDLLISMIRAIGGTAYLCGGGAGSYQEDDKFIVSGIELIYQNFQHPIYPQINTSEFIPGLSIVDALMNYGIEGTRRLLQHGNNQS